MNTKDLELFSIYRGIAIALGIISLDKSFSMFGVSLLLFAIATFGAKVERNFIKKKKGEG